MFYGSVIHEVGLSHALLDTVMGRYGLAEEEARRKKDEEDRGVVVDNASTVAAAGVGDEAMEEGVGIRFLLSNVYFSLLTYCFQVV